jgi:pyruvate/2-oxoglutarate dehydrogenase complex dihydrolipoamide dehydrogenase (E3) component
VKSGEVYEQLGNLADYGLKVEERSYDFSKIVEHSRGAAKQLSSGVAFLSISVVLEAGGKVETLEAERAIAARETQGFVKTVFDAKTGALLGAHMIGSEVTEMIQGFALAMTLEATEAELMATVFPHPTMSEAMHEAVLDAYGQVLHR